MSERPGLPATTTQPAEPQVCKALSQDAEVDRSLTPVLVGARTARWVLDISGRALFDLSAPRGPIPVVRIGKRAIRYHMADLLAFIESRKTIPRKQTGGTP